LSSDDFDRDLALGSACDFHHALQRDLCTAGAGIRVLEHDCCEQHGVHREGFQCQLMAHTGRSCTAALACRAPLGQTLGPRVVVLHTHTAVCIFWIQLNRFLSHLARVLPAQLVLGCYTNL
jgi:hypothetical protein